jgi:non-homologous end joining protein Ku
MKRQFSESEKMLVEGMVGLFVLLPNPQLKGKEQEVMKIAYELLEERLNKDFQPKEDDDGYDDYINYLVEKHK